MEIEALINLAEVVRISGLSKSEIWRRVAQERFPQPVKLGPQTTRWPQSEVLAWVSARLSERSGKSPERLAA